MDQALSRLVKGGHLLRVARGIYVAPVVRNNRVSAPSIDSVAESIAVLGKQAIALDGASAAKTLGLTRQRSANVGFVTTGRNKQLRLGNTLVEFNHAPYWMLSLGQSPAGDAVRALAWVGQLGARKAALILHKKLSSPEWGLLESVRASLPSWMAKAIGSASRGDAMYR